MTKAPPTRQDDWSFLHNNNPEAVAIHIIANTNGLRKEEIMYDYRSNIADDIRDYIESNFTAEEIIENLNDRDEWEQSLYDDMWLRDSVTGNASGSYYCNSWKAEEAIAHNWGILADAIEEFGGDTNILRQGAETCDVTIRCYLLGECLSAVLDDLEAEAEDE